MEPGLRSTCDSVRDLAGRLVGAMQSKWGRHCCRPHFHQRVDTLCSHDFRRTFHHVCCGANLAPDVWPLHVRSGDLSYRDCSPALAPASGFRSCPAASFRSPKSPMAAALRSRLAETVSLYRSGLAAVPDLRPSLSPDPAKFAACPVAQRRSCLKQANLHLAEASCMSSLNRGVDNCHRHPWDKNLQNFKALRLSVPVGLCPEDKLKVRLNPLSGNIRIGEFSTFGRIGCGRTWISQRFIAFVAIGVLQRERNRPEMVRPAAMRCPCDAATRGSNRIRRRDCGGPAAAAAARSA